MKRERCDYCGTYFANEAAWEHHLKSDFGCIMDKEMRETTGFIWTAKGWAHDAPVVRHRRAAKRPPDLLGG